MAKQTRRRFTPEYKEQAVARLSEEDAYHRVDECRDPSGLPECEALA